LADGPRRRREDIVRRFSLALILVVTLAPASSRAQFVPLEDHRWLSTSAYYAGLADHATSAPAAAFAYWNENIGAHIDNPNPDQSGYCDVGAFQISQIVGNGISASGGSGGGWYEPPLSPNYFGFSIAHFRFRLLATMQANFDAWLEPGPEPNSGVVLIRHADSQLSEYIVESGELHTQFRLPPGEYEVVGSSLISSSAESASGATYTYFLTFPFAPSPLVLVHPRDTTVSCGATPVLSVTTSVPAASLTFQWRRNLVPLVNGPHVSGVTTPTLTLPGACVADSGWYDVVVSDGSVTEPSRLTRVNVNATSDVPRAGPATGLALALTGPNPFAGGTTLRYVLPSPGRVTIAVHDVRGARVRSLLDAEAAGAGTVAWDGRTDSGGRAAPGLYFVHLETPWGRTHRAIVLLH
jgi:hypothetical protein